MTLSPSLLDLATIVSQAEVPHLHCRFAVSDQRSNQPFGQWWWGIPHGELLIVGYNVFPLWSEYSYTDTDITDVYTVV